jgi:chemotaxis family two-component system response regulator Rcp1
VYVERVQRVLVVEDDPADVELLRLAFEQCTESLDVHVVGDGASALRALREGDALPDWVLLDLNLPRANGKEVLKELREDPLLAQLGVVVFSSSSSVQDVSESYALGANCYVEKPDEFAGLIAVLDNLARFWRRYPRSGVSRRG